MLELHCHTTYSDGTLAPTELVAAAVTAGVRALAITDHDTLDGWDEARAAAPGNLEIVPGIELSTVWQGRSLHVLGYYPDRDKLAAPLQVRRAGRLRRAQQMVEKLTALGYPIELPQLGDGMAPGRPHLARALVLAGHARTVREAFDRWLHDNGPAYACYENFSAVEGIQLLRACGGLPVWAHPYLFQGGSVASVLPDLVAAGLMGIEVYHPNHSSGQRETLLQLARDWNLFVTGGSDYHGPPAGERVVGGSDWALNSLQLPLGLMAPLRAAKQTLDRYC